jgi:AraC family transcriptional regulator
MEWLDAMNEAIEYLEDHITEKLDVDQVAKIALSSTFHFQRMYHMITGLTIAEYVRRRRLTLAAQDIISGEKVIDVAYKYSYESPEAFTKAFGKMHGMSPSAARKSGANLKAYPKLSFHISIKGDKKMNYKIIEKESFNVVGRQRKISMAGGENFKQVPAFWHDCMADGSYEWISSEAGELGVSCISKDFDKHKDEFIYMIGIREFKGTLPQGYSATEIPAMTWAVFESVGALPEATHSLLRRIFTEWMPATGYQHACAPEMEVYPKGDLYSPDYKCEIWIPVKK